MLEDRVFISSFVRDNIPDWPCPNCGVLALSCEEGNFNYQPKEPLDTSHPGFDPEYLEYIFSTTLSCSNANCGCNVVVVGTGEVVQEYLNDGTDNSGYFEYFQATYFEPPLRIFMPATGAPTTVKNVLDTSFSVFFSKPNLSLVALRSALEVLLSDLGIPLNDERGGFLNLARRIQLLPDDLQRIIEPANAVRWLGNDGTHGGGAHVAKTDVLDGYRVFEHILNELYPEVREPVDDLVARINESRGLVR